MLLVLENFAYFIGLSLVVTIKNECAQTWILSFYATNGAIHLGQGRSGLFIHNKTNEQYLKILQPIYQWPEKEWWRCRLIFEAHDAAVIVK